MTNIADIIADQWRGLKKFAADLAEQLPSLGPRGNRGLKANLTILEKWIRAALLKLAEQIELPARRTVRRVQKVEIEKVERGQAKRRLGFRCIEPDDWERSFAAENRFDISSVSGCGARLTYDPRPKYRQRLEAIEAVLDAPERYALRVKRKLEARRKRPNIKRVKLVQRSALPDLMNVSRHSDLGRYIWYNDSS